MAAEEIVLPFPGGRRDRVPPTTHVKGTWIASSLRGLRNHGLFDAYLGQLAPEYRDAVLHSVTTDWHPLDVLLAHYEACDRLGLSDAAATNMGRDATSHAQGGTLGVTARLVTGSGVTPWTILPQFQRFWDRFFRGGGVRVLKLGPKEARVDLVEFPGLRFSYCRSGVRGVVESACALFCRKVYTTELASAGSTDDLAIRIAWV